MRVQDCCLLEKGEDCLSSREKKNLLRNDGDKEEERLHFMMGMMRSKKRWVDRVGRIGTSVMDG